MTAGSIFLRQTRKNKGLNPSPPSDIHYINGEDALDTLIRAAKNAEQQQIEGFNCSCCDGDNFSRGFVMAAIVFLSFLIVYLALKK
jgi:hypothetical protein